MKVKIKKPSEAMLKKELIEARRAEGDALKAWHKADADRRAASLRLGEAEVAFSDHINRLTWSKK